jgi:hypothetical protein
MSALAFERIESELQDQESDQAPYRIVSYPADYTLKGLHDKWKAEEIEIPPFQRQYVWTLPQASRLIESFLLGLPVPGIFFYKDQDTQRLLVIDGQQRLRSVFAYFDGKLPDTGQRFSLRGVRPEWDGRLYADLPDPDQIRLRDAVLRATIVDQLDPKDNSSIFHIFERLNTGGTILKPQEVRNCIYHGSFNDLLVELNREPAWRNLVGSAQPDKRMRDVELILRFLALVDEQDSYAKPMKDFLSTFMRAHRKSGAADIARFRHTFVSVTKRVTDALGARPFHIKAGINAAVFDSVMVAFASHSQTPRDVRGRLDRLLANDSYKAYVSTGTRDVDVVRKRIRLAKAALFKG